LRVYDIGSIDEGDFYIKFFLRNKSDGFKFVLYMVYGPAQQQNKEDFLIELANTCSRETHPYIVGGDFNIMRHPDDKSKGHFDTKWPNIFNAVIESVDLKEIVMSGQQYTWAEPGDDPTYEKLDRVLVSTEWNFFPLSTLQSRDRSQSDHTPLILNSGSSTHNNKQTTFKFEREWLIRDGFFMVAHLWPLKNRGGTTMERWQNKIRHLGQYMRGWTKDSAGSYKKEKKKLISMLDAIDKKAKNTFLSDNEIKTKHYLKEKLVLLLREEEMKWYERAKVNDLLEGDDNTHFFHLVANGKHHKHYIFKLEQEDGGIIVGDTEIKSTSLIITKAFSDNHRTMTSALRKVKLMIYHKSVLLKMI